jgi:hypothetical protein
MKSALASQITKALLLSFLATSFVACKTVEQGSDFSSRSPAAASLVSSKKSLQQGGSASIQGPGDSGGGNGVGGKAYESYIVDLEALPEFQQYLVPIIEKLGDSKEDSKGKKTTKVIAELKTWYIAPVKLKPIDKSILGVSFSKDKTEQLAIQTKNAIWIDQQKWNRMKAPQDRAMLLLHEITMAMYLLQFEDMVNLCAAIQSECKDVATYNHFKEFQPTPRRALTNDDYENIRAATFWLKNNAKAATPFEVAQMFGTKNFDQRFYSPRALKNYLNNGNEEDYVKYNPEDAALSLSRSQVLNKMPDKCYAVHTGVHFDCTVTSTPALVNGEKGAKISVNGKNFSRETLGVADRGPGWKDVGLNGAFKMQLDGPISCQIGSVYQQTTMFAFDEKSVESNARDVLAILFEPMVVFESKDSFSSLAAAKVTSLETDTIVAYRSDVNFDVEYLVQTNHRSGLNTTTRFCK